MQLRDSWEDMNKWKYMISKIGIFKPGEMSSPQVNIWIQNDPNKNINSIFQ